MTLKNKIETIGILGGGQLGRMTALAAARLGFRTHIFCSREDEPALDVTSTQTIASFEDKDSLKQFAQSVDVVTSEWENVPLAALQIISQETILAPSKEVMAIAQDRIQEKTFARSINIGTANFIAVESPEALDAALKIMKPPVILKSTRMGYDGKGQVRISEGMSCEHAWKEMGSDQGILEEFIDFDCEISTIVVRGHDGAMALFPTVRNMHHHHILSETHAPSGLNDMLIKEAEQIAARMSEKLNCVGLLAVEMFVLKHANQAGQRILMNEIAPRPHNSGHWTIDACPISQFEYLVRALVGLPLCAVTPHSQAVMKNLIGADVEDVEQYLKESGTAVHLYGKKEVKAGRKMGHVTILKGPWHA